MKMKKFVAILVVMMMAVMALVPVFNASAESAEQLFVNTENGKTLNLRANPNSNAKVLSRLGVGKTVTLIDDSDSTWAKVSVKLDGKTVKGYVQKQFIDAIDPAYYGQEFTKVSAFKVTVTPSNGANGKVNMRAEANPKSTVRAYLYKGDVLTVKAESHAYYKVTNAQGQTGYVLKAFVTK